jgi:hypothetical protein
MQGKRSTDQAIAAKIARPSVDPELMIRVLLVGYCFFVFLDDAMNAAIKTLLFPAAIEIDFGSIGPKSPQKNYSGLAKWIEIDRLINIATLAIVCGPQEL